MKKILDPPLTLRITHRHVMTFAAIIKQDCLTLEGRLPANRTDTISWPPWPWRIRWPCIRIWPRSLKLYRCIKNEVSTSMLSKVRAWRGHTDTTERIITPHSWMVINNVYNQSTSLYNESEENILPTCFWRTSKLPGGWLTSDSHYSHALPVSESKPLRQVLATAISRSGIRPDSKLLR